MFIISPTGDTSSGGPALSQLEVIMYSKPGSKLLLSDAVSVADVS